MSVKIMSLVWDIDLPASQKIVLLAIADCANDEGRAWPSVPTLARKCSKSERTVQGVLIELEASGHITRNQKPGKGCLYTVHPTPAETAPPQKLRPAELAPTPADSAPKPSKNHQSPSVATQPTEKARAKPTAKKPDKPESKPIRLPPDWEPEPLTEKTAEMVEAWPVGMIERELSKFKDYWAGAVKNATSPDWQAKWRTWLRNADERSGQHRNDHRNRNHQTNGATANPFVAAGLEFEAECAGRSTAARPDGHGLADQSGSRGNSRLAGPH